MLDLRPDWQERPNVKPLERIKGRVEFENVSFAYEPGRPVFEQISFVAEPGQTIALVGQTGSGKSTIASLIQKLHLPASGRILIDQQDILEVSADSLHRQMGTVQQANVLFAGSLLDNIRFARPEASEEQVRAALKALDCLDLIDNLPEGLQTRVGERNAALSLGERQVVCFARAFLVEATSAIDSLTEARIQRALEKLLSGRTAFAVAHRLSTIHKADLVLVLEKGRIEERVRHNELVAAGGLYARLHEQFIGRKP